MSRLLMKRRWAVVAGAIFCAAMTSGCGLDPITTVDEGCTTSVCTAQTTPNNDSPNQTTFFNNTINNVSPNNVSPNNVAPNTGPNTGTNNVAPNTNTPDDGCELGATECADDERYRTCVDNGQGGTLWSNPAFCDYAICAASTQRCCDAPCDEVGKKRCLSGQVQECVEVDGCLEWSEPQGCLEGQICGGEGVCMSECESNCSPDETRCLMEGGPEYQTCVEVAPGCHQFGANTRQCGAGQACENGACVTSCSDTCPSDGAKECNGTTERTCQRGAGGCLAWANTGSCAPMAECFSNSLGGINVPHGTCVQNATTNTFHTCSDGSTGCLWAFCNDGSWLYQCNRGNTGMCAGNTSNSHSTCN